MEDDKKRMRKIRTLPRRLGGLGLITHSEGVGDKNILCARQAFTAFINLHYSWLNIPPNYFYPIELLQLTRDDDTANTNELLLNYYSNISSNLLEELAQNPNDQWFAAWFRSSQFKGSGKWLDPLPPHFNRYKLSNTEMVCSLRTRLGFSPFTNDMLCFNEQHNDPIDPRVLRQPITRNICTCTPLTERALEERNPLHCFDCYQAKDLVNKRHNLVRNILRELIKKARKGSTVDLEPNVVGHAERPDLMVHMGGRTTYLDVVITNQSCPSQLAQHHSDTVTDAANIDKERLKSLHYRNWTENVIPIAIEATGRFGPSALKYIKSITQQMGKAKAMYLQEIQWCHCET